MRAGGDGYHDDSGVYIDAPNDEGYDGYDIDQTWEKPPAWD